MAIYWGAPLAYPWIAAAVAAGIYSYAAFGEWFLASCDASCAQNIAVNPCAYGYCF